MALQFFTGSATQGSADAFVQTSIATGLANISAGYRVRGITWQHTALAEVDCNLQLQLNRRSATAVLSLTDRRVIHYRNIVRQLTTSGLVDTDVVREFWFDQDLDLLIVEDPVYLVLDSASTGAANDAYVKVYYEQVRLTETQKLAALSESLNA